MALRFNPPPGWPAPPEHWAPPHGWAPDPAWGPVPEGWSLWLDDGAPEPRLGAAAQMRSHMRASRARRRDELTRRRVDLDPAAADSRTTPPRRPASTASTASTPPAAS